MAFSPQQLRYSKTHEWVRVETDAGGRKTVTVGLSDFAIKTLTDLVFIELPAVGRQVSAGQSMGEVESVKAVSDIYSPVDGEVAEVNAAIPQHLETLSKDPYGEGWLVRIRMANDAGLSQLLDYAAYQKQCEEEG